jgi:O-methyltransferase
MKNLKLFYYSLPLIFINLLNLISSKFHNPIIIDFINQPIGKKFGLKKKDRLIILKKIIRVINNIESATSLETQITLVKYLLQLPKTKEGNIVECGCFKGASSTTMSIICEIIGRKLIIYDSFEGLPKSANKIVADYIHFSSTEKYKEGMYLGNLHDVKKNISNFGCLDVCIFRKGFFHKTLPKHSEKIEFLFIDVDLLSSTKTCIKNLWKKVINRRYVFTDDSCDLDNVKIWFDNNWWKKSLNLTAPGYVGSGCGLPLNYNYSGLGYTIKNPDKKKFKKIDWIS